VVQLPTRPEDAGRGADPGPTPSTSLSLCPISADGGLAVAGHPANRFHLRNRTEESHGDHCQPGPTRALSAQSTGQRRSLVVEITSKPGNAILMSVDDDESWQETADLLRSPANA